MTHVSTLLLALALTALVGVVWADEPEPVEVSGVRIEPGYNGGLHTHGGPPATITRARFRVHVLDDAEHGVALIELEHVRASRGTDDWRPGKILDTGAMIWTELVGDDEQPGVVREAAAGEPVVVDAPAGSLEVALVDFTATASQGRQALRAVFEVDGERVEVVAPLRIKRLESYRPR